MKKFIILTIILVVSAGLKAFDEGGAIAAKGKIKGVVADAKTEEPIEYATVALYNSVTGQLVDGTITDYLGHFRISPPEEPGDYYVLITFIGLDDLKSDVFTVNKKDETINLGHFLMQSTSKDLGEVEVVGKRAPIEYRIDKKVINVDKQITSSAGTAVDILENVPSVQVDIEGNVSLRGSTGFTVLIDGKPTILEPSDALRQIPSSSIENIEIITNPSVKYEPDGATGIINIITKKNRLDGLSLMTTLNGGTYGELGGDLQLSYRANKFNFIAGANYRKHVRPGEVVSNRETYSTDTTWFVNSSGDAEREHTGTGVRLGVEYNPTKNDFLSLGGRFGNWGMVTGSTLLYDEWNQPGSNDFSYNSKDETTRGGNYMSVDGVYQHDFKAKQSEKPAPGKKMRKQARQSHNIKLQINYRNHYNDENSVNELYDLSGLLIGGKKNVEKGPSASWRINLDYSLPLKKMDKFEAGLQSRIGNSDDITELYLLDTASGELVYVPDYSNTTDYNRNIYAAYALYAGMAGDFGYQAGLRGEYTYRVISTTGQDDFVLDRWDYFPTLHLSYNLPADQQLMASYTRRIDRPRGWYLEPFVTWVDAYNVRQGNPNLKPEYIDSYDMGYLIKFNDNFFSLEGYYRVTHNKVERVTSVYTENVMMHTFENVGEDYSLGIEAMLNLQLFKWWELDVSGNFFNYKVEGVLYDDPFSRSSTNWNSRLNNTFTLWKNGLLQINSRYNSGSVTAQGTSSGFYTLDAAFKVSFLQKQLSANLQARDILGTALREYSSEGQDFYSYYKYNPKSPSLTLTISYRFNNYKPSRRADQNGSSGEEEF